MLLGHLSKMEGMHPCLTHFLSLSLLLTRAVTGELPPPSLLIRQIRLPLYTEGRMHRVAGFFGREVVSLRVPNSPFQVS